MLWDLPVTPPQGTRCFSVLGRFHFIQVFEVQLKNLGTVKFFLWRQDSVLSRFHWRQVLLYFYLSRMWGWRRYLSSGWIWAGWTGCHSWQWQIFFCLLVHTDLQGPIQPSTHPVGPRDSFLSHKWSGEKLSCDLYIGLKLNSAWHFQILLWLSTAA